MERWVGVLVLLKVDIILFITETRSPLDDLEDDKANDTNTNQRCNSSHSSNSTLVMAEAYSTGGIGDRALTCNSRAATSGNRATSIRVLAVSRDLLLSNKGCASRRDRR